MDAIYTAPLARPRTTTGRIGKALAAVGSVVVELIVESARGEDFQRRFTNAPGAQFAALPESSKQRLLDRGFRS